MSGNSWEVDSYQQGKWRVSVRENPENDRLDEGDYPEGHFYAQRVPVKPGDLAKFNVFKDHVLVAEVRGTEFENRIVIPMRELSQEDDEEFNRFIDEKWNEF